MAIEEQGTLFGWLFLVGGSPLQTITTTKGKTSNPPEASIQKNSKQIASLRAWPGHGGTAHTEEAYREEPYESGEKKQHRFASKRV